MSIEEVVARLEEQIKTLFVDGERREKAIEELGKKIDEIKDQLANRLPTWATMFIAFLTAALGGCIGYILGH